jgi:hypothetical protein
MKVPALGTFAIAASLALLTACGATFPQARIAGTGALRARQADAWRARSGAVTLPALDHGGAILAPQQGDLQR